jgi:hypothetical protein
MTAPDWAKGYSVEDLRRVTTLFNRHDEGLLLGPFDRYRDRDAAGDLQNGWLKLGPRDDEGVPAWACVVRELGRRQPVHDFTGARMTLPPGTRYCTRMAFSDDADSILAQLSSYDGPVAIECWQEHPGERALVARAADGGMTLAAVKIKTSSSMRGLWVSHDIEHAPYPKQELLGLAQLPLALPHDAILALREDLDREPRDTQLRATLAPAAEEILATLPCAGFERIRLMRLTPGAELSRHVDTDPDAGVSEGKVVRVHIPLISNERCALQSWDLDGNTSSLVVRPGTAAYLDVRKPHAAVNMGDTAAVHLVVDCYANAGTVELLRTAAPEWTNVAFRGGRRPLP